MGYSIKILLTQRVCGLKIPPQDSVLDWETGPTSQDTKPQVQPLICYTRGGEPQVEPEASASGDVGSARIQYGSQHSQQIQVNFFQPNLVKFNHLTGISAFWIQVVNPGTNRKRARRG
jgi:hypothetical protein